jgi:hypothetical protein
LEKNRVLGDGVPMIDNYGSVGFQAGSKAAFVENNPLQDRIGKNNIFGERHSIRIPLVFINPTEVESPKNQMYVNGPGAITRMHSENDPDKWHCDNTIRGNGDLVRRGAGE